MIRRYFGKAIIRTGMFLEKCFNSILMWLILAHIRNEAHRSRRKISRLFGSKSYWPSIAQYSEIKGEFLEGWIPYDYFRFTLLPKLNPKPAIYMDFKTLEYQLFGDFAVKPLFLYISGMFFDANLKQFGHGYWDAELKHHDKEFNSYDWMVDGVIRQIEKKTIQTRKIA